MDSGSQYNTINMLVFNMLQYFFIILAITYKYDNLSEVEKNKKYKAEKFYLK